MRPLISDELAAQIRNTRLIAFDFDGVFTDNGVYVFDDGTEAVRCWRGDGIGLRLLERRARVVILSTEKNPVVRRRAEKLEIECHHGLDDKLVVLERLASEARIALSQVAYVGNDINDAPCLRAVGLPIVVADAHPDVLELARLRTRTAGGQGAVREVCDLFESVWR
ncbi:MAG TPA: HAD hydrolase family protein [Polyangiaceae bacterium]|nr:HAD hydrolase family protein [Polyangiaceae bacterium]